jgi:hypothetical protein
MRAGLKPAPTATATTTTPNGMHYKLWITHSTVMHYAFRIMNYPSGCIPQQLCIMNYELRIITALAMRCL